MSDDNGSSKPSITAVDRRVGRLEERQDEMQRSIDRLEINMQHQSDLARARFDGLDNNMSAVSSRLDAFISEVRLMQIEGAKTMGDINATPVGRTINAELIELKLGRAANAKGIAELKSHVAMYAGGLAMLSAIVTLFGPAIRSAFGLGN